MSRYTGPKLRKMRALGIDLPGLSRKSSERRPYRPGEQGTRGHRRRMSSFGTQLIEKQKLRFNYGVTERQLRILITAASKKKGDTRELLAASLESRLDNVVFRAGLAPTIPAARQLVNHGHVTRNGRKTDIASCRIEVGDVIQVKEKSRKLGIVNEVFVDNWDHRPDWLEVDMENHSARMTEVPASGSIPFAVDLLQVVEYYSSRI